MDGYLTYKVDINSTKFLDFLNLQSSDLDSYETLITNFDNEIDIIQSNLSYEISFIDFAVNTFSNYGFQGYLTPSLTLQTPYLKHQLPLQALTLVLLWKEAIYLLHLETRLIL